jgi:hypothetical protein
MPGPNDIAGGQVDPDTDSQNPIFNEYDPDQAAGDGSRQGGGYWSDRPNPYGKDGDGNQLGYVNDYNGALVYNSTGSTGALYTAPTDGSFVYANQNAFNDPNAANIYNVINNGINNRANQVAPTAYLTALGNAAQVGNTYGVNAAQIAPQQMLSGAQISPQMMANAAKLDTAGDAQYRAAQNQELNRLSEMAQGRGPSVAETQAKQLAERNIKQAMAMQGSGGGPLAQRRAALAVSEANQAAAAQGALGRSSEALSAGQQLGQLLSGARGQTQTTAQTEAQLAQQALLQNQSQFNQAGIRQADINQAAALANQALSGQVSQQQANLQQQAGQYGAGQMNAQQAAQAQLIQQAMLQQGSMNQQTGLANLQAQSGQNQLNQQAYNQLLGAYMQQNQADISNQVAYQQLLGQQQLGIMQVNSGNAIASNNAEMGLGGAAASAGGALLMGMMSDRRVKTNIVPATRSVRAFLNAINGW